MDNSKLQHQRSMTVDEQIENLKSLDLIINDEKYAEKILNDISYFRLIKAYSCAHYGRLYNEKLSKIPKLYKEYSKAGISNDRLFGVLLCLKHILNNEHWEYFVIELEALFEKYENINISTMGFPKNWKELLYNSAV